MSDPAPRSPNAELPPEGANGGNEDSDNASSPLSPALSVETPPGLQELVHPSAPEPEPISGHSDAGSLQYPPASSSPALPTAPHPSPAMPAAPRPAPALPVAPSNPQAPPLAPPVSRMVVGDPSTYEGPRWYNANRCRVYEIGFSTADTPGYWYFRFRTPDSTFRTVGLSVNRGNAQRAQIDVVLANGAGIRFHFQFYYVFQTRTLEVPVNIHDERLRGAFFDVHFHVYDPAGMPEVFNYDATVLPNGRAEAYISYSVNGITMRGPARHVYPEPQPQQQQQQQQPVATQTRSPSPGPHARARLYAWVHDFYSDPTELLEQFEDALDWTERNAPPGFIPVASIAQIDDLLDTAERNPWYGMPSDPGS